MVKHKATGLDFSLSCASGKFIWPLGRINSEIPSPACAGAVSQPGARLGILPPPSDPT